MTAAPLVSMVTLGASDFAQIFPDIQGLNQAALQTIGGRSGKVSPPTIPPSATA